MTKEHIEFVLSGYGGPFTNALADKLLEMFDEEAASYQSTINKLNKALSENKGEWERVCGGSLIDEYRCSKCKHLPPKKPLPDIKTWGWDFTDFCPNCGADMREPKEEKGEI